MSDRRRTVPEPPGESVRRPGAKGGFRGVSPFFEPSYVRAPTFEIASNPKVEVSELVRRRFFLRPRNCPACGAGPFSKTAEMEAHLAESDDAVHAAHEVHES